MKWVNRESFTKPTLWYGSPARAEWLWMLKLFKFAASTFSLQARRADTSPAGGDSHRTYCVNNPYFVLSPPSRSDGGEDQGEGALFSPCDWFWCVRDRDDGVRSVPDESKMGGVITSIAACDRYTHPTGLL